MLFILFVGFELLKALVDGWFAAAAHYLALLWLFVVLHEFGHCFAARSVGGQADQILLWPLGGLAMVDHPRRPWPEFVTVAGGPLVNVVLFLVAGVLLAFGAFGAPYVPWNPFHVWEFYSSWPAPLSWLALTFKLNLILFLFNMWPMYPMDMGRILHCAL